MPIWTLLKNFSWPFLSSSFFLSLSLGFDSTFMFFYLVWGLFVWNCFFLLQIVDLFVKERERGWGDYQGYQGSSRRLAAISLQDLLPESRAIKICKPAVHELFLDTKFRRIDSPKPSDLTRLDSLTHFVESNRNRNKIQSSQRVRACRSIQCLHEFQFVDLGLNCCDCCCSLSASYSYSIPLSPRTHDLDGLATTHTVNSENVHVDYRSVRSFAVVRQSTSTTARRSSIANVTMIRILVVDVINGLRDDLFPFSKCQTKHKL